MLEFKCTDIRKAASGREILKGVSISAPRGKVVALLGPNGAGKTTCFSILCGLIKPDSGKVIIDDSDVTYLPMYKRARMGIGYLPQEPSVFRGLTVEENIMAVLENNRCKNKCKVLHDLLNDFSIYHVRNTKAVLLSGGERRKLEIARALANFPKYILLDEPLAGIDPIAISDMKEVIKGLKSRGIGVIITDHNVRDTLPIVDTAYIIKDGQIMAQGTMQEVVNNKDVISAYLGDSMQRSTTDLNLL